MRAARLSSWPCTALVIDPDPGKRHALRLALEAAGETIVGVSSIDAALDELGRRGFDVVFLEESLTSETEGMATLLRQSPDHAIVVMARAPSIASAVDSIRRGAIDYVTDAPAELRRAAQRILESARNRAQAALLRGERNELGLEPFHFESRNGTCATFLEQAARAALGESAVLLRGESGTGKNVYARWLHRESRRAHRPFVTVHCPALGGDLMTSVLFGHCRGAFTGAIADRAGSVEHAEGGVLFLDEVGDLVADAQARLLRFLNDRSYERLGENRERTADVRVIAATNRELETAVAAGRFREDLFYRLNVISLTVPPLRERREDLLPLARHFIRLFTQVQGRSDIELALETERLISQYDWPGNIRELRNAMDRAIVLAPLSTIEPRDLGIDPKVVASVLGETYAREESTVAVGADISLEALEREHIASVVARAPTLEAAARTLGINPTTLQRKRKRYGLV
ncbi:MAG: sigma-54-dependent Fis family transcriptional regulator [Labilithrix sp.]|nr:sigma-54-dependent Fis family transcriptional regulator [Labilithrix sp.]